MKLYKSLFLLLPLSSALFANADIDALLEDLSSQDYEICQEARLALYSAAADATSLTAEPSDRQALADEIIDALRDPESVTQAKVFLTRILTRIGTESSAEALIKVALDKKQDPVVREHAILAVSAISGESVTRQIIKALDDADNDYQDDWWQAMGLQTSPESVNLVIKQIGAPNIRNNSLAITALGKIGGKDAAEFLAGQLDKTESSLLPVLERAILNTKGSDSAILSKILKSPSSPTIEIAAFEQLLKKDADAALGHLKSMLKQADSTNRQKAIRLTLDSENKKLRTFVISQLPQLQRDEVSTVITVIGEQKLSDYEDLVIEFLDSESTQTQITALRTLGKIGSSESTKDVLKLLKSEDEDIQDLAIYTLAQIDDPKLDEEIVRNVMDKKSPDRGEMIELIAIRNSDGANEIINGILEEGFVDPQISEILSAVELIGDVDSCRILIKHLIDNPKTSDLRKAQLSLKRLTIRLALDDYLWNQVFLSGLQLASNDKAKASIVEILDCLSSEKALAYCEDSLDEEQPSVVRKAAEAAMRRWTSVNIGGYWTSVINNKRSSKSEVKNAKTALVRLIRTKAVDGETWEKALLGHDLILDSNDDAFRSDIMKALKANKDIAREFQKKLKAYQSMSEDWENL